MKLSRADAQNAKALESDWTASEHTSNIVNSIWRDATPRRRRRQRQLIPHRRHITTPNPRHVGRKGPEVLPGRRRQGTTSLSSLGDWKHTPSRAPCSRSCCWRTLLGETLAAALWAIFGEKAVVQTEAIEETSINSVLCAQSRRRTAKHESLKLTSACATGQEDCPEDHQASEAPGKPSTRHRPDVSRPPRNLSQLAC